MVTPSTADDTIARHCIEEATEHLAADVGLLKDVRAAFFSAGVHAVSIPLKLRGHVHNHTHTFLAKLVTKDCVRAHREVMTKKNTRFKKHGVYDISYKEFDAACGLLNSEARLLKASRAAGYFCTVAIRRISAALCRLGVRVRARNSV